MARKATDHLQDVLEAIAAIAAYTRKGKKPFEKNPMLRDRLAHKHALLDARIVWAVVENDLPKLHNAIGRMLKSPPNGN